MTNAEPDRPYLVMGIFDPEGNDESFVYTNSIWRTYDQPELWCSCLGECGHRMDVRSATLVVNELVDEINAGRLAPGGSHDVRFESGTLTFTIHPAWPGNRDKLKTYAAPATAPVCAVKWRCCAGKVLA